ncbi:MAG: phospho-N-acetylmuramoyl-pentapeptide-transferase, partial [Candidatus Ventricola sp.]
MQRMMLSVVLAFLVGALLGKLLLPVLYKLKFGQNIYELAPEAHKKKQGTPIMGGLTFAGAAILIGLLMNDYSVPLTQNMTLAVILMALGNMCIGFAD